MKRTALIISMALLAAAGCVQRRMTIISEPAGATAYLDGDEIGKTPATTSFLFYGGREIRLEMDGYETLSHIESIEAPYYQKFPFDLVADVFVPWTITDRRFYPYKLKKAEPVSKADFLARAEAFRTEHKASIVKLRQEHNAAEMERRMAERRKREKEGLGRRRWYRLFF